MPQEPQTQEERESLPTQTQQPQAQQASAPTSRTVNVRQDRRRFLTLGSRTDGASNLELPVSPTEKMAIVGVSGSGKSYLAGREAEEWLIAGVKICALDPVGIWWGLRSGADGNPKAGMPVKVYGGMRGEEQVPDPKDAAGRMIEEPWSTVFDLSVLSFETMHWWVGQFLNEVGQLGPTITTPIHLFLEEAPMLAPQTGSLSRHQRECKAAITQCARVYRNFGIGMTVIAQRASAVDKNLLTQCQTLVALRIAAKLDRRALVDWGAANSPTMDVNEALDKLSSVQAGRGIIWSPTWGQHDGVVFQGALRSTYHPDPGDLEERHLVKIYSFPRHAGPRYHDFRFDIVSMGRCRSLEEFLLLVWRRPTGRWEGPYNQEIASGFRVAGLEFSWKYFQGGA